MKKGARRGVALLLAVALAGALLPRPAVADDGNRLLVEVGRPNGSNFAAWRDADKKHLRGFYDGLYSAKGVGTIYSEWLTLQRLAIGYTNSQYNIDPETGLHVFPAPTTGMLLAIGDAMRAREEILNTLSSQEQAGQNFAPPSLDAIYPVFGRSYPGGALPADGQLVDRGAYANVNALLNTIKDMQRNGVATSIFDNAAVVVTPFSFANLDDGGWIQPNGPYAAWISSTRATNHPVGTLVHLTGHFVLDRYFGKTPKEAPENWNWLLNLRGDRTGPKKFVADTDIWANRSSENFAEDFRLAFGTAQLESYPSRAAWKSPSATVKEQFRRRLMEIMDNAGVSFHFQTAQISDGDVTAVDLYGLPTNRLMTPERVLTVSGAVSMPGGGRPRVTVYGRTDPKKPYLPMGGSGQVNPLGQFEFPLNLAQGTYDILLEASIPGENVKAQATFKVSVISRRMAGESYQQEQLADLKGHWARPDIMALVNLGAVAGYPDGTFKPNNQVRRGEFFKIMITALEGASLIQPHFSTLDQPLYDNEEYQKSWARNYIDQAYYQQFYNQSEYHPALDPDEFISRQEMARLMGGALEVLTQQFSDISLMNRFKDLDQFDDWRVSPISVALANGVVNGYPDGTFKPRSTATRAEACVMINRLVDKVKELKDQGEGLQFFGGG
jgi:hypothetical protein